MHRALLSLPLLAALALPACASRYEKATDAPAYAGMAKVVVTVNKTENRHVKFSGEHLAPPSKIDPSLKAYVIWFSVPGHGVTRAGVLDYDRKKRSGRMHATTPHRKFEVIMTLESNSAAAQPGERVVFRQLVGK